jgi:hypothetical protein
MPPASQLQRLLVATLILSFLDGVSASEGRPGRGSAGSGEIQFDLPEVQAAPGDLVTVPVRMLAVEPVPMVAFSIEFESQVLEVVEPVLAPEILEIIERRSGIPGDEWQLEWFADNAVGWVQVSLVVDFEGREEFSIPPGLLAAFMSLTFRVKEEALAGPSPLTFTRPDGAAYDGHFRDGERPVYNAVRRPGRPFTPEDRFEDSVDPELDDGSVLVSIIGDVGIFVRGDSNDDGAVDISDPITTLGFLFGEDIALSCLDAADSNDDGSVNISDPIDTLGYLFGEATGHARGLIRDETADALDCAR